MPVFILVLNYSDSNLISFEEEFAGTSPGTTMFNKFSNKCESSNAGQ